MVEEECPALRTLQPVLRLARPGMSEDVTGESLVPFPETPKLVEARILAHPAGGRDCLLATTEDGQRLAFGFEAESDRPGLEIVDPQLWLEAASEPEDSPQVFDAVKEINADDWPSLSLLPRRFRTGAD